ncbi:unnamed protein product, partial [marine sediment metagenome]
EANTLGNLGVLYQKLGKIKEAIEHYQKATEIHKRINNLKGEADNLGNIGILFNKLK